MTEPPVTRREVELVVKASEWRLRALIVVAVLGGPALVDSVGPVASAAAAGLIFLALIAAKIVAVLGT